MDESYNTIDIMETESNNTTLDEFDEENVMDTDGNDDMHETMEFDNDTTIDQFDEERDLFSDWQNDITEKITEINGIPITPEEQCFLDKGCGCTLYCIGKFTVDEILKSRLSCQEMSYYCGDHVNHHQIYLKGILNTLTRTDSKTMPVENSYKKKKDHKLVYTQHTFRGVTVCRNFFEFVNATSRKQLRNLRSHFLDDGVSVSVHGNSKKISASKKIDIESWKKAVSFISSYGTQHGLVLPGRIPSFKKYLDLLVLPSMVTKFSVYQQYTDACEEASMSPISKTSWYTIWNQLCSNVVIQNPKSDLCVTCKNSITSYSKLHNMPEEKKQQCVEASLEHLKVVDTERSHYKNVIEECKAYLIDDIKALNHPIIVKELRFKGAMHLSFDYAQQIFIPQDSQQVGPIYFLAPYKVALFGVAIEPFDYFVLYVIPEAYQSGKGANSVISFLHHCLENFSFGASNILLHADNCTGQNKHRYMLQYLTWRVVTGLNLSIELSFLHVGHTKFHPDAYFGKFKSKFARSKANCLKDICRIATTQKKVSAVLVGDESGNSFVNQFDWCNFFNEKGLKTVKDLQKVLHLKTDQSNIGIMSCKNGLNESSTSHIIVSDNSSLNGFPDQLIPAGLSDARKSYLYSNIRPYVDNKYKNVLCPKP